MSYDSYGTSEGLAAVFAIIITYFLIGFIIGLVFTILRIVGQWKAFKKAGKSGWEAIIPIYNVIVCCQIVGVNPWWILIVLIGGIVLNMIPVLGSILSIALSIYFAIILNVSIARSFGKSDGYAAGLIFLAPIFWLLIGSKNTTYVGPKPMGDKISEFLNSKTNFNPTSSTNTTNSSVNTNNATNMDSPVNNNFTTNNTTTNPTNMESSVNTNYPTEKFCTGCGTKVSAEQKFCPSCGKEL